MGGMNNPDVCAETLKPKAEQYSPHRKFLKKVLILLHTVVNLMLQDVYTLRMGVNGYSF